MKRWNIGEKARKNIKNSGLYIFEAENNETISAFGLFNSDDAEAVLTSHDYDVDKALSTIIDSQEKKGKVNLFQIQIDFIIYPRECFSTK